MKSHPIPSQEAHEWPDSMMQKIANSLFQNSTEGVCITDSAGTIVEANPTLSSITGFTKAELIGSTPELFSSGIQGAEFYAGMWKSLNATGQWQGELWNRHKQGQLYAIRLNISAITDENGVVTNYLGILADITARKHQQTLLEQCANHDALTGLPNRLLLADRISQARAQARRSHSSLAICYLDLDGFKPINDRMGHAAGDHVLIQVARRLGEAVREGDTVARVGGDEFILLLWGLTNLSECEAILNRVVAEISTPIQLPAAEVIVTASIGVAIYPNGSEESQILVAHADNAMYRAKTAGGNCWRYYAAPEHPALPHTPA